MAKKADESEDRPSRALPSDRVSFPKQLEILRAIGAASDAKGGPVTNVEVGNVVGMVSQTVSLMNGFFTDIGLLEKTGDGLLPCPEVVAMKRAYEWNPDSAMIKLAPVIVRSWFAVALMPKLQFRPITMDQAIQELAEAASAGPKYRNQLEALVLYMQISGIVSNENGTVRLIQVRPDAQPQSPPTTTTPAPHESKDQQRQSAVSTSYVNATAGLVQFNISVKVDMQEMAAWTPDRIQAFFAGIAQVLAAKGTVEGDVTKP